MTDLENLKILFPGLIIDDEAANKINKINKTKTNNNELVVAAEYFVNVLLKLGITKEIIMKLKEEFLPIIIDYANKNIITSKTQKSRTQKSRTQKSQMGGQLYPFINDLYCRFILFGIILYLLSQIDIRPDIMDQALDIANEGGDLEYPLMINYIRSMFRSMFTNSFRVFQSDRSNRATALDILDLMIRMRIHMIRLIPQIPGLSIAIVSYLVMVYLFIVDISIHSVNRVISGLPPSRALDKINRVISGQHPSRALPSSRALHLPLPPALPLPHLPHLPPARPHLPPPQTQALAAHIATVRRERVKVGDDPDRDEPPQHYTDWAFTTEVMTDPVIAFDGHTYERASIEEWFQRGHNTSPVTGEVLPEFTLIPNHLLRSAINEYIQKKDAAAAAAAAAKRNTAAKRIHKWWIRTRKIKRANGGSRRRRYKHHQTKQRNQK